MNNDHHETLVMASRLLCILGFLMGSTLGVIALVDYGATKTHENSLLRVPECVEHQEAPVEYLEAIESIEVLV